MATSQEIGQRFLAARALLLASRSIATRIELAAMELLSGWGLCVLDDAAGRIPPRPIARS